LCGAYVCAQDDVTVRRPPKFSWVVDGLLAAQGRPTLPGHLQYLCNNNVKYIVTLTKTKPRALLDLPGVLKVVVHMNSHTHTHTKQTGVAGLKKWESSVEGFSWGFFVSNIAIFMVKWDVKLQLTNFPGAPEMQLSCNLAN